MSITPPLLFWSTLLMAAPRKWRRREKKRPPKSLNGILKGKLIMAHIVSKTTKVPSMLCTKVFYCIRNGWNTEFMRHYLRNPGNVEQGKEKGLWQPFQYYRPWTKFKHSKNSMKNCSVGPLRRENGVIRRRKGNFQFCKLSNQIKIWYDRDS